MVENLDESLQTLGIDNQQVTESTTSKRIQTVHRSQLSLDVNDILSLDLDLDHSTVEPAPSRKSTGPMKVKCCPTLIGGTASARKFNGSHIDRMCVALHCRDCDFPVSSFPDYQWSGHVEYLFLRTNMPDFGKIMVKLSRKTGTVAYACHCVSFSADRTQALHETTLPWFCRGHPWLLRRAEDELMVADIVRNEWKEERFPTSFSFGSQKKSSNLDHERIFCAVKQANAKC